MILKPSIFKAYDIRGEWNKDWDSEGTFILGQALALHFKPKRIAIGYDMRFSSPEIFEQLTRAFRERSIDVVDLGICATELVYFVSSYVEGIDLSIMITASHNPGKDNGLKVVLPQAVCIGAESGLNTVCEIAQSLIRSCDESSQNQNVSSSSSSSGLGGLEKHDAWGAYQRHVFSLAPQTSFSKKYRLVIDAGNAVGSLLVDKVLAPLNLTIARQCWELDGSFPHHPADPSQQRNTLDCQQRVREERADFGVCLDGDSDRVFFVDEKGRYIPGYYLAALLTDTLLQRSLAPSKECIVHDPRYYRATREVIATHGAVPLKVRVGHTLIKDAMRRSGSVFSAECSGHIFYRQNQYAESTMLTILYMLSVLEECGTLSRAVDCFFGRYPMSGEINFIVDNPSLVLENIEKSYSDATIDHVDGVDVVYNDWRCSIRTSNTQPLLRLNVEAQSSELVDERVKELRSIIGGTQVDH